MSQHLSFEIQFHSDFHIGAGHGLGLQVDSALLRDSDGVPVIRGTILNGLLRDSLHDLLRLPVFAKYQRCRASGLPETNDQGEKTPAYCGQFDPSAMPCPVCAVFGSPQRRKRWRISSARPNSLAVAHDPRFAWSVGETAAQTATRVRVNPRTRRAEENKLFAREEGDGRLLFHFSARCLESGPDVDEEAEWLVAAARWLRRIGASKLRGRGECTLRLTDPDQGVILHRLQQRLTGTLNAPPSTTSDHAPETLPLPATSSQPDYRVRVVVRTEEPLLLASRAEAGNQFATLDVLPGAALRGALAWQVARQRPSALRPPVSDGYRDFVRLFFGDAVRFSPLVPVRVVTGAPLGHVTLVAPRDLVTSELYPGYDGESKDNGNGVWSQAWQGPPPETYSEGDKLESVPGFIPLNPLPDHRGLTVEFRPRQTVEMHIRMLPATGRVQSGDLFGYVALEPGQYFVGEIACASQQVWDWLYQAAGFAATTSVPQLHLGRASQRGYGLVSLLFQPLEAATESRHGASLAQRVTDPRQVVLLLESDTIVTDSWGRFVRGFDPHWLKKELDLPPTATVTVKEVQSFSAVRPVDTFNAKLGLPRSRDLALAAGSCALLSFDGIGLPDLVPLLGKVEANGIGLRRQEGFGRVAFNHPLQTQAEEWEGANLDLSPLLPELTPAARPEAHLLKFRRRWERQLDEALGEQADGKKPDAVFEDGRFEALARLLHVSQATTKAAVDQVADELGRPDQLLDEELPGRDKKNFYTQGEGKAGLKLAKDLVAQLETLTSDYPLVPAAEMWRLGLSMLADRIAGPARRKADEGR